MYIKKNEKGVTLVELVLSVALILIVLQVIYSLFFVGSDSVTVSTNKGFSQQGVRNTNIFLESELKYANNFYTEQEVIEGIPNTVFYSLSREDDYLVVSKYSIIKDSAPTEYNITEVKRYRSESDEILINNTNMGLITISLGQLESSGRKTSNFNLQYHIYLDDGSLQSNLEWDISNEGDVMYFSKIQDAIEGSIILNNSIIDEEQDGEENPTLPDDSTTNTSMITINTVSVWRNDDGKLIEINPVSGRYALVENKAKYTIIVTYVYNGTKEILINTGIISNSHDIPNKKITLNNSLPQGQPADIEVVITISAVDAPEVKTTIIIGR